MCIYAPEDKNYWQQTEKIHRSPERENVVKTARFPGKSEQDVNPSVFSFH